MKGFAYLILIVMLLSIIMEPFTEVVTIYVEKAKLDSALKNAGRLAVEKSVGDHNRAEMQSSIDHNLLISNFNTYFSTALDLTLIETSGSYSRFHSNNQRYNDFSTNFDFVSENKCRIKIRSKYKYKTKYLKLADSLESGLVSYDLEIEEPFIIKIRN